MNELAESRNSRAPEKKRYFLSPVLILLAVFYVSYLLYQAVYMNYITNKKIDTLRAEAKEAQLDKERLELLIAYYKTSTFQELEARKKLGLKMPGEKVVKVNLPESASKASSNNVAEQTLKKSTVSNPQNWFEFIAGHDQP